MQQHNISKLNDYCDTINRELMQISSFKPESSKSVCDAMEYSLTAGGKRIRPLLALEFCRICGGDTKKALRSACALELIHTYSLIHDDLPCMDDDDYRRGRESCHKKYGEDIALLAGDALNSLAFEVIASEAEKGSISFETGIRLISVLSKRIGADGMIGGQVIDLESEGRDITIDTLDELQEKKTGALIEAACLMGFVLSGSEDETKREAVRNYAFCLGKAFQIVDDILDVEGSFEELGKPIGSDKEQGKNTYVTFLGLDGAKKKAAELTDKALKYLDAFDDNEFLKELTGELLTRKK